MGQEINGEVMDDEAYKGYVFRITGGNDKQGFQMKQGIMSNGRTRILFKSRKSTQLRSQSPALSLSSASPRQSYI